MSTEHKHFSLFNPDANYDFVGRRQLYYALTGVGILASVIALATLGFNKGIDFKGGSKLIVAFEGSSNVDRHAVHDAVAGTLQQATGKKDVGQVEVQDFSTGGTGSAKKHFSVVTELTSMVTAEKRTALTAKIKDKFPKADVQWAAEGEDRVFVTLVDPVKVTPTYDTLRQVFGEAGFPKVGTGSDAESQLDVNLFRTLQMLQSENKKEDEVKAEEQKLRDQKAKDLADRADSRFTVVVEEFKGKIETGLQVKFSKSFAGVESSTAISPSVADDLMSQGLVAILYAIVGIILYIVLRFDVRYAPGALIALVHDVVLVIGAFSVAQVKFSMPVIAAVLTVAGYSITDTIVVFDRIREMQERHEGAPIDVVINSAINTTMSRTVLTSLTTFITSISIFLFGGGLIRDFAFAMCIGVVVGTFSSIFVASPVFLWLHERFEARKAAMAKQGGDRAPIQIAPAQG
ncbi:MAG: protein translocase subunit SecF [Deltaproteobacteria bacterium]|nr:protein translocase subunit SecF [Deltaproteobacteria bacterium]